MNENNKQPLNDQFEAKASEKRPDDSSGIHVEAKIKIFDPESEETFVEGRA